MSDRPHRGVGLFLPLVTLALLILTNIPLLCGYLKQPPGLKFMGIIAGVRDTNFYFMMMQQADGWSPILRNYFAPGEPDTIYHGFFWFFLGKIQTALGLGEVTAYHAARTAATILFVPAAYYLICRFLRSAAERMVALVLLSFGAGAGWIWLLRYYRTGNISFVPVDIGTPEASSFFTLMTFPHLSFALVLIVLCVALFEDSVSKQKTRPALAAGGCGLALGFIHAVNLVIICAALAVFSLASLAFLKQRQPLRSTIVFGAVSVWPIVYYGVLMLTQSELLPHLPVRSPAPAAYAAGFAPYILLSAIRVGALVRSRTLPREDLFLICWAITNALLLYSYPLLSQEGRAVLGLQIPLVLLSVRSLFAHVFPSLGLIPETRMPTRRLPAAAVVAALLVFTIPTTFCNIFERVSRLAEHPESFSLTQSEYEALLFLRDAPGDGVVLSGDWVGNYVPRIARKYSWLGQYDLPSHDKRLEAARTFFAKATTPSSRREILKANNIAFVFYGGDERTLGAFDPDEADFLTRVFARDGTRVYRVELDG